MALVSVIIPCHNAQAFVAEAIQSALDQSHQSCEVIVIDDGSTDASLREIKSFGNRIRWETGPNRGGCAARNRGLELAEGTWVQFLDADDRIMPDKIAKQVEALTSANSDSAMAMCPWCHFDGQFLARSPELPHGLELHSGSDLLICMWKQGLMFPPHVWLTPLALIQKVGGWNPSLVADQDGEFFGRLLVAADKVKVTDECDAHYRIPGPANVSACPTERAMQSRLNAWVSVQQSLIAARSDRRARRAVLRRLRAVAYQARNHPSIVDQCDAWEKRLKVNDFDIRPPRAFHLLCSVLGLKLALSIRTSWERFNA
jgi:glycosyltransferase involved in cell wall biosynthesis